MAPSVPLNQDLRASISSVLDQLLEVRAIDGVPLANEDLPFELDDFGVPGKAVMARPDLVSAAVVGESAQVDAADGCGAGGVRLALRSVGHRSSIAAEGSSRPTY